MLTEDGMLEEGTELKSSHDTIPTNVICDYVIQFSQASATVFLPSLEKH